jgi:DNA-binding beta-propeller fold protein YncE
VFAIGLPGRGHRVRVIDVATDRLTATIPLLGKQEVAVVDGCGRLIVNIEDTKELTVIDTVGSKVELTWALKGCVEPAGLAIDAAAHRLFVGCHKRVMLVVNARHRRRRDLTADRRRR